MTSSITEGLFLASQSPRRIELLAQLGLYPRQISGAIDETPLPQELPEAFVERMARGKARAGVATLNGQPGLVLGADTEVVLDGEIFGKPHDLKHAGTMLARLSGRMHRVLSAVCLAEVGSESFALSVSDVEFAALSAVEIDGYLATGEALGKAGAYAIQGHAAQFIRTIRGSYSGIMGLPLFETAQLLHARMQRA
jgi:septum formation protein